MDRNPCRDAVRAAGERLGGGAGPAPYGKYVQVEPATSCAPAEAPYAQATNGYARDPPRPPYRKDRIQNREKLRSPKNPTPAVSFERSPPSSDQSIWPFHNRNSRRD